MIEKLISEGKIKLVEPSTIVSISYNEKSKNALKAAKILLHQNLLEESLSMAYYAMYHKASSLLFLTGIKSESHASTIVLLKELFCIDNSKISLAKKERIDKQYYTDFIVTKEDVSSLISIAEDFIAMMDTFIDKVTEEDKLLWLNDIRETYFKK